MVEAARTEAHTLIEHEPDLKNHPLLATLIADKMERLHFE
jgi:hypothetical protein